ncbi:ABATE domain-containing protein [Actinomadura madurae]|uniref:ABATE domain-containing protein n=1 Tax=Actinomadura madurae TaxID=1993 RepID=UPI003556C8E6
MAVSPVGRVEEDKAGGAMADTRENEGPAQLLTGFVNTLDVESAADALATPGDLAGWLAGRGLVPDGTRAATPTCAPRSRSARACARPCPPTTGRWRPTSPASWTTPWPPCRCGSS